MVEITLITAVIVLAGTTIALLVRRERALMGWVREEVSALHDNIDQSRMEVRSLAGISPESALDTVEDEEYEIAANIDRMNLLLDRLNGLLRGKAPEPRPEKRRIVFREETMPLGLMLDFTSPEELEKFGSLPPISDEEMEKADWECLFEKLRSEGSQE